MATPLIFAVLAVGLSIYLVSVEPFPYGNGDQQWGSYQSSPSTSWGSSQGLGSTGSLSHYPTLSFRPQFMKSSSFYQTDPYASSSPSDSSQGIFTSPLNQQSRPPTFLQMNFGNTHSLSNTPSTGGYAFVNGQAYDLNGNPLSDIDAADALKLQSFFGSGGGDSYQTSSPAYATQENPPEDTSTLFDMNQNPSTHSFPMYNFNNPPPQGAYVGVSGGENDNDHDSYTPISQFSSTFQQFSQPETQASPTPIVSPPPPPLLPPPTPPPELIPPSPPPQLLPPPPLPPPPPSPPPPPPSPPLQPLPPPPPQPQVLPPPPILSTQFPETQPILPPPTEQLPPTSLPPTLQPSPPMALPQQSSSDNPAQPSLSTAMAQDPTQALSGLVQQINSQPGGALALSPEMQAQLQQSFPQLSLDGTQGGGIPPELQPSNAASGSVPPKKIHKATNIRSRKQKDNDPMEFIRKLASYKKAHGVNIMMGDDSPPQPETSTQTVAPDAENAQPMP